MFIEGENFGCDSSQMAIFVNGVETNHISIVNPHTCISTWYVPNTNSDDMKEEEIFSDEPWDVAVIIVNQHCTYTFAPNSNKVLNNEANYIENNNENSFDNNFIIENDNDSNKSLDTTDNNLLVKFEEKDFQLEGLKCVYEEITNEIFEM